MYDGGRQGAGRRGGGGLAWCGAGQCGGGVVGVPERGGGARVSSRESSDGFLSAKLYGKGHLFVNMRGVERNYMRYPKKGGLRKPLKSYFCLNSL